MAVNGEMARKPRFVTEIKNARLNNGRIMHKVKALTICQNWSASQTSPFVKKIAITQTVNTMYSADGFWRQLSESLSYFQGDRSGYLVLTFCNCLRSLLNRNRQRLKRSTNNTRIKRRNTRSLCALSYNFYNI